LVTCNRKLLDAPVGFGNDVAPVFRTGIGHVDAYDATVLSVKIGIREHLAADEKGHKATFDATDQELGRSFGFHAVQVNRGDGTLARRRHGVSQELGFE